MASFTITNSKTSFLRVKVKNVERNDNEMKKVKIFLSLILIICLITVSMSFASTTPTDVKGTKYEDAVDALTELGIINALTDGLYKPSKTVSRAEVAKLLVLMAGLEDATPSNPTEFTDVSETHWAYKYINIAAEYGYIAGYPGGNFYPEDKVTYNEFIYFCIRLLGYGKVVDADTERNWPENVIYKATELGLLEDVEYESGNDDITRGETAIIIWNTLRTPMWEIGSSLTELEIPTIDDAEFDYTGAQQTITLDGFDSDKMEIIGDSATYPGEYTAVVSLKKPELYKWSDGTTEDKEISWSIVSESGEIITVPVPVLKSEKYTFNGEEQTVELQFFQDVIMTISGDTYKDAGEYKLTIGLKDKEKYAWAEPEGSTEDKVYDWKISKVTLNIPVQKYANEYTGEKQEAELMYYDSETDSILINMTGNKQTAVGVYTAEAALIDSVNSCWEDNTTEPKKITWEIIRATIDEDDINSEEREYTGEEQVLSEFEENEEYNDLLLIVSGDKSESGDKAIDAGTYEAIVKIKDPTSYMWEDKTTGEKEIKWKIIPAELRYPWIDDSATLFDETTNKGKEVDGLEYNGKEQKVTFEFDDDETEAVIEISGDKAKDIGKYTATATLKDTTNYTWTKGKTEPKEYTWYIVKGYINVFDRYSYPYKPSQRELTKTYNGEEQQLELKGFDSNIMTVSGDKATNVGTYKAIITSKEPENYGLYNGSKRGNTVDVEWEIEKLTLEKPYVEKSLYTYTGKEITLEVNDFDERFMTITGNKATKVGDYKATISLKSPENVEWSSDDSEDIVIEWSINKNLSSESEGSGMTGGGTTSGGSSGGSSGGGGGGGSSSSDTTRTYEAKINQTKGGTVKTEPEEVKKGEKQTITITPEEGYKIVSVKVDGKNVGAVSTYTIEKVKSNPKITVTFEKLTEEELKALEEEKKKEQEKEEQEKQEQAKQEEAFKTQFEDIKENDWYYDAVKHVYTNGLFKGVEDNKFEPQTTMNRAMLVTVLHRLADEEISTAENTFKDVKLDAYYAQAVNWAIANEIVTGISEKEFSPNGEITREQLVTMLYRYAKFIEKDVSVKADLTKYEDANTVSDYAIEAFAWAVNEGYVQGRTEIELAPKATATRAEVATILMRFEA